MRSKSRRLCALGILLLAVVAAACGDDAGATRARDAEQDAGPDAEATDAANDAGDDAAPSEPTDAGPMDADAAPSEPTGARPKLDLPKPSAGACAFEPLPPPASSVDNPDCPDGIFHGDITLRGAADFDRLRGCTRLDGDLTLDLLDAESLEGLESLRVIDGAFATPRVFCSEGYCAGYNKQLRSLRGLENLRCVSGDFELLQPEDAYCKPLELDALDKLVEIGGSLALELCTGTAPESFAGLQRVWGDMDYDVALSPARLEAVYGTLEAHGPAGSFLETLYVGCREGATPCRDGVLGCSFEALTQPRVAALGGCELALRDLNLAGTSITSLKPLAKLRAVRGALSIGRAGTAPAGTEYGRLASLAGLEQLERVGALVLGRLPFVTTLQPLAALKAARSLRLDDLDGLLDLNGLEGLTRLESGGPNAGELWIGGCAKLETLTGLTLGGGVRALRLIDNAALERIQALASLSGTLDVLVLEKLPALNNLDGLQQVAEIAALEVQHCSALLDLSELAIKRAQRVALHDIPSLSTLQDFLTPELTELQELHLSSLPSLQTLAGLEQLTKLQALSVVSCEGLSDLTGLGALREVEQMLLRDDSSLASLAGAAKLERVGLLELHSNPALASLSGLGALQSVSLSASDLPELANLSALAGVTLGSLELQNLPLLTDLAGLESVSHLFELTLSGNAQLSDIAALAKLEKVDDALTVSDNPMLLNLHGLEGLRNANAAVANNQTLEEVRALGGLTQGSVDLTGNSNLPPCEIDWLKSHTSVSIEAQNNGATGSCPL